MSEYTSRRSIHSLRSRVRYDECEGCAYCGLPFIEMHHEHDHAPVPDNMGGAEILPTCMTCHDMKDRVAWENWPASVAVSALVELQQRGRLADFSGRGSAVATDLPTRLPDDWSEMSTWARIVWAKMTRCAHQDPKCLASIV